MANLKFINLGYGYGVCANRVVLILKARTKQGIDIRNRAKDEGKWISCTARRPMSTILVLDNDFVIGCAFTSETLIKRFKTATEDDEPSRPRLYFQEIGRDGQNEESTDDDEIDEINDDDDEEISEDNDEDDYEVGDDDESN